MNKSDRQLVSITVQKIKADDCVDLKNGNVQDE